MGFAWDIASRIFLGLGALLVVAAGLMLRSAPTAAVFPLALGGAFLLAAVAMAYERKPPVPPR